MESTKKSATFLVIGDVHGHLQLALCMAARLQREAGVAFDGVFLCGDVGTFTDMAQLDSATVSHAKTNSCELEFIEQWAAGPARAPWLEWIFREVAEGGLGLMCPVVMVHGNHEGFAHLETLVDRRKADVVGVGELPRVDAFGAVRYLPSGWRVRMQSGHLIGGIGGIEAGQRSAKYHPMAYIRDEAVEALLEGERLDILLTHQGPAALQGEIGSPTLDMLLDAQPRLWFHGHGMKDAAIRDWGEPGQCTVVPLGDVAFVGKGASFGDPGVEGYARVTWGETVSVVREAPAFWREYRQKNWKKVPYGWVCPDLAQWAR